MSTLARLKPFDGKRFVIRSYTVFGIKFIGDRGWYKVDSDVSEYLKTIVQRAEDPDSAPAFDVCSEDEAKAIDERERVKASRRDAAQAEDAAPMRVHNVARPAAAQAARAAIAATSGDLTTDDIRHSPASKLEEILGPADAAPDLSGSFDDDMAAAAASAVPPPVAAPAPSTPKGKHGKKAPELL